MCNGGRHVLETKKQNKSITYVATIWSVELVRLVFSQPISIIFVYCFTLLLNFFLWPDCQPFFRSHFERGFGNGKFWELILRQGVFLTSRQHNVLPCNIDATSFRLLNACLFCCSYFLSKDEGRRSVDFPIQWQPFNVS